MAKWQHIKHAEGIRLHTVADLLMDDGKIIRATWRPQEGQWCDGRIGKAIAWFPDDGSRWRGGWFIPLYTPLSFRIIADGAGKPSHSGSYDENQPFLEDNGLSAA